VHKCLQRKELHIRFSAYTENMQNYPEQTHHLVTEKENTRNTIMRVFVWIYKESGAYRKDQKTRNPGPLQ